MPIFCLKRKIKMPTTFSLCMIVKNEEKTLGRCLDSVAEIVDEIIIVDTGSKDRTVEIARKYTDKIFFFDWRDDFAAARNYAFSKGSQEYNVWLDADDVIEPKDKKLFLDLKNNLEPDTDIVMLPYVISVDEQGNPSFHYYRERIIKNSPEYFWQGRIHEAIVPFGKVIYEDAAVTHKKEYVSDPNRNIRILEEIKKERDLTPREEYYYGRELFEKGKYLQAIETLEKFLKNPEGWVENKIDGCMVLSKCYQQNGDVINAFRSLFESFLWETPRAEVCCELGRLFLEEGKYLQSIHWYKSALEKSDFQSKSGFINEDYYGYIPYMGLCVAYDRLGDKAVAKVYNEMAGLFHPLSEAYIQNKKYFQMTDE